ncbi:MAG: hypothetical protein AAGD11_13025 [Planctomycetota bacterium]
MTRRLVAPVASIALLSGSGLGTYHYYGSVAEDNPPADEATVAAHSASTSNEELKLLFSSDSMSDKESTSPKVQLAVAPKPLSTTGRYAIDSPKQSDAPQLDSPKLPPLVSNRATSPEPVAPNKTSGGSLMSTVGDRYAKVLTTAPTAPEVAADAVGPTPVSTDTEVARGQDPSTNPLRTTDAPATSDARAAFGQALASAPTTPSKPVAVPQPSAKASGTLATALQQARPLQPSPPVASGRYQTEVAPIISAPASVPTAQTQSPAPPLQIQTQPPRQQPVATQAQNPFGAPPASLRTSQLPNVQKTSPPVLSSVPKPIAPTPVTLAPATPTPGLANHPGTGRPGESLLEGAQSPTITIQKLSPEEIQVGKRCTFAIRVQNSGQRAAQNVQIRDEVPLGTELVGTAPRATISGTEVVWDMGTLSPGEERTVEMELLPKEEGELGSVATVSIAAQASAKSRCTRPELALRLSAGPQVHVGDQQVVQIEISNPGSGDATGVMLLETVPTGVSHEAGPALEFEVGTLRAGETRRMELVLSAEQAGRVSNVMTARADASLQVDASCEFEVIAPELQLSIEGPQRRFLERPATYRVSIDNPGTASAKDVQLVTHLPKGMQFVSANNMGEYDSASHSVHWSLAELPANERGTVELIALPIEPGSQTLQVATKASLGLEDQTDKRVLVEGLSALMFEVEDVEGLIEVGGETTYEIRVRNQGSKAATNVQIVAVMPPGIRPIAGQGETRHAIQGERVVFSPLAQLAPKSDTKFRIQAQGIRPGDQRVRVQISADDLQQPITKEVSTKVYADE